MPFQSRLIAYPLLLSLLFLSQCLVSLTVNAAAKLPPAENITVTDARVRPTNPGQEVGAAYMTLSSKQNAKLVAVESDVTKSVEIHSMTMNNGVMKMRMLDTLNLTAGKPYALVPGGYHLMLFDLKKPLVEGEMVNFTLHFKNRNNSEFQQKVLAKVLPDSASSNSKHH
ncbi:MAG: copper chaperone PCu(A)C [Methylotenera sp.]|nr:copper chaperone PCu(A)C [Methylotenera sp.]